MADLLKYHIDDTNKKFDDIKLDLADIKEKVDNFRDFKVEMIATSRMVSMIISAICGFITLVVSVIVTVKYH